MKSNGLTKAEALKFISDKKTSFTVLPLLYFSLREWKKDRVAIESQLTEFLQLHKKLIVRSSSLSEDNEKTSNAGGFDSFLNVTQSKDLYKAVENVFLSFSKSSHDLDQVLVQPMVSNVVMSGVVFTRELDTLAPYFIINYDDMTSDTTTVTSGTTNSLKTKVIFKEYETKDPKFKPIINACKELEEIFDIDHLDIEFAMLENSEVVIFQCRPIVLRGRTCFSSKNLHHYLEKVSKKIEKNLAPHPYLGGSKSLLSVMTDWNPAEMIGTRPRTLALSLYKYLITDRTWAYQRDNYGYKNLRSFPLIRSYIGIPYVDIRLSFNSFIPKALSHEVSSKISEFYLEKLSRFKQDHDKVEFNIVHSCYTSVIRSKIDNDFNDVLNASEKDDFITALYEVSLNILKDDGLFVKDVSKLKQLQVRQETIYNSSLPLLDKIYWLVEDCARYGTLPFAGLARSAFISIQLLQSFVEQGQISEKDYENYMLSLNTVSKQMGHDLKRMSRNEMLDKYGHLRPGTYDIMSSSYKEDPDFYLFSKQIESNTEEIFTNIQEKIISPFEEVDVERLMKFICDSIEYREKGKFIFTKSVSMVLELITELGQKNGFSKEDMSHVDINTLLGLYSSLSHQDLSEVLEEEINKNNKFFNITRQVILPDVISSKKDVWEFDVVEAVPNYITLKRCESEVVLEKDLKNSDLANKIIFIEKADPGYDWLFTKNIGALITKYGGANSHMAIRASELSIPAVIGAGESLFKKWSESAKLIIDCEKKIVIKI
jgi:phosphohistidine swiveling domain-containing protein